MKIIITALAAMLLFIACENKSKTQELSTLTKIAAEKPLTDNEYKLEENKDFIADSIGKKSYQGESEKKKQPSQQPVPNPDWDKKIIKTANLNLQVKDYNIYYAAFREKVRSLGGYVAQEEQTQSDYKIENTLIIKVPVDQFDNAVVLFTNNVEKINERKISSQDVTTEFVDTKSRIESKKQVRLRYMDLQKQAKNMEEILSVQSEINGIQEEIESATGRIEYLGHSSTFSTINLTYYQVLNSSAKDTDSPSFGTKLSSAFKTGWSWIGELFVGLVSIWPLFLLIFVLIIFYRRMKIAKPKQA
jgi:Tfp pilus assembly protein PilZ